MQSFHTVTFYAQYLSIFFAFALGINTLLRLWLNFRQARHVQTHRIEVPKTFADKITLAAHQKAADYTLAKLQLDNIELILGALILVVWTLLGGLSALNQWISNTIASSFGVQLLLLAAFVALNAVIDVPFSLYRTFVLEQRFGFNQMTLKLWLLDLLKSSVIGLIIGLPIAAFILYLMQASGHLWWLWAWCVWTLFSLLMLLIYPTFIAPIFNKFEPLQDTHLAHSVAQLMQRCNFTVKGFFVMDGSRRSAHANAYFTGLGTSKRVVFFDTLLKQLDEAQILAVLAHELGHFKHKHVLKRMVSMFAISFLGFALLGWLSQQLWFYLGLGVVPNLGGAPNDALALLLFALALPIFSFFMTPVFSNTSRKHEFEADNYAVKQTNAHDLGSALLKLYEDNASTLTPDPLFVKFYYSHPPALERLNRMGYVA